MVIPIYSLFEIYKLLYNPYKYLHNYNPYLYLKQYM